MCFAGEPVASVLIGYDFNITAIDGRLQNIHLAPDAAATRCCRFAIRQ